jgi:6-pyruvoyl-tetrahydropterin synthase
VLSRYDLQNLNTLQEFAQNVPTTENLSVEIYEILQRCFEKADLERVWLEETMMNSFEYVGASEPRK